MSDLQDAFDWVDSGPTVVGAKHINALADAARRVANPDYEAAKQAHADWWRERLDNPAIGGEMIKRTVDAALNVTEDE